MNLLGIDYASSDEEEEVQVVEKPISTNAPAATTKPASSEGPAQDALQEDPSQGAAQRPNREDIQVLSLGTVQGPPQGPSQGPIPSPSPAPGPSIPTAQDPSSEFQGPSLGPDPERPTTPTYTSQMHPLTLPPVPNFTIPASPPTTPPPASTNRFTHFLALKARGEHFNTRLTSSATFRHPANLSKLYAQKDIELKDQYASTLPEELAVPVEFPRGCYFEGLRENQRRISRATEKAPRDKIEFVSAGERVRGEAGSRSGSARGTPTGKGRVGGSTAERVLGAIGGSWGGSGEREHVSKRRRG